MRLIVAFMSFVFFTAPVLAAGDGGGMIDAIRTAIQDVCVSALAAMAVFAALCFVAEMVRRVMAKLPSVTLAVFLFVVSVSSVIIGGGKTNGLLQAILPFVPQVQQVQLPQVQPVVPPSVPRISAPSPRASADMPFRARAWNRRGAWDDSFRCAFLGEWVFPKSVKCKMENEVSSDGIHNFTFSTFNFTLPFRGRRRPAADCESPDLLRLRAYGLQLVRLRVDERRSGPHKSVKCKMENVK